MGPLAAALLLLLGAAPLAAQANRTEAAGPGTASPSSGNCGLDPRLSPDQMRGMLRAVYDEVFLLSGLPEKPPLLWDAQRSANFAYAQPSPPKKDMAGDAVAGPGEIHYNPGLCDALHSLDEVAFVFGHELGHIGAKDFKRGDDKAAELDAKCGGRENACFTQAANDFRAMQEKEADAFGLRVIKKDGSRFQANADAAARAFMDHLRDLFWAIGAHSSQSPHYAPPSQRAEELRGAR